MCGNMYRYVYRYIYGGICICRPGAFCPLRCFPACAPVLQVRAIHSIIGLPLASATGVSGAGYLNHDVISYDVPCTTVGAYYIPKQSKYWAPVRPF